MRKSITEKWKVLYRCWSFKTIKTNKQTRVPNFEEKERVSQAKRLVSSSVLTLSKDIFKNIEAGLNVPSESH